jgi:hypothetical protein
MFYYKKTLRTKNGQHQKKKVFVGACAALLRERERERERESP